MLNATYDLLCTFIILPAIVWIGANGVTTDRFSTAVCENLGNLSYPVYIVHYPLMYLFYSWYGPTPSPSLKRFRSWHASL